MFRIERFVSTRGSNTADWQALRGYGGSGVYSLFVTGEFWKALLADEVLIRRLTGDSATNEYVRYVLGRSGYECYIEYHRCIPREVLKDANGLYGSELIKELDTDGLWRRNWDEFLARYRRDDGTVAY